MKIFILEDNLERIKWFKDKFIDHTLFISSNVDEAIKLYDSNKPFDTIFLDHDLDDLVFVNSNKKNTGYQFAKFLSTQKNTNNTKISIY